MTLHSISHIRSESFSGAIVGARIHIRSDPPAIPGQWALTMHRQVNAANHVNKDEARQGLSCQLSLQIELTASADLPQYQQAFSYAKMRRQSGLHLLLYQSAGMGRPHL